MPVQYRGAASRSSREGQRGRPRSGRSTPMTPARREMDLKLRTPGPEPAPKESHGVSAAGTESQVVESTEEQQARFTDGMAQSTSVETPFGAPVVREFPPDPGPHERLMTVRGVADLLGVSSALVYKLCQRSELSGLRIGGSLRFQLEAVDAYLARRVAAHSRPKPPPGGGGAGASEDR